MSSSEGMAPETGPQPPAAVPQTVSRPFPFKRLLFALGFLVAAWFVFWLLVVIALAQFVVIAFKKEPNAELKAFAVNLCRNLWQLTSYMSFARDEKPFPDDVTDGPAA